MDWIDKALVKMKRNKITQRTLADKTGYSYQYICEVFARKKKSTKAELIFVPAINEIIEEKATNENKI